jgi:hypothetical protein
MRLDHTVITIVFNFSFVVAAYYRIMRITIKRLEEESNEGVRFNQAATDLSFLKVISERVSEERLMHSFQTWFFETFLKRLDVEKDITKAKDRANLLDVKNQYFALLIVNAIALSAVGTELLEFIKYLVSDVSLDPVWHCVAIILFGLSDSQVRDLLSNKASICNASSITHVAIVAFAFFHV